MEKRMIEMTNIPVLETERLILRANRLADFEAYARFYTTDRAAYRGGIKTRTQAFLMFAAEVGHWSLRGYGMWALEERASGAYCGQVGLWNPEGWPAPEVGWLLMEGFEGRGYALEAALRARDYAYDVLGWTELASCIYVGNDSSIRLAERMGALVEARVPREGRPDMLIYRHPGPTAPT